MRVEKLKNKNKITFFAVILSKRMITNRYNACTSKLNTNRLLYHVLLTSKKYVSHTIFIINVISFLSLNFFRRLRIYFLACKLRKLDSVLLVWGCEEPSIARCFSRHAKNIRSIFSLGPSWSLRTTARLCTQDIVSGWLSPKTKSISLIHIWYRAMLSEFFPWHR